MTCIAVRKEKDHISLCGDTELSYGRVHKISNSMNHSIKEYSKIVQVWDLYFGHSGELEDALVMKEFAKTNLPKDNRLCDIEEFVLKFYEHCKKRDANRKVWSGGRDRAVLFILVFKGKAFFVWDYLMYEIEEYDSIWSGMFYARTAMYLGKSAKDAVDVAKEFAGWVGGKTHEVKIPLDTKSK